jgi:hypothetical protein
MQENRCRAARTAALNPEAGVGRLCGSCGNIRRFFVALFGVGRASVAKMLAIYLDIAIY